MISNTILVCNKATRINDLIAKEKANLCFIEIWLEQEGGVLLSEICPATFQVWHQLRLQDRGGGIVVIIQETREVSRGHSVYLTGYAVS